MKTNVKEMVRASLMAALACVATMAIRVPSPLHGYINMGDVVVLLAGWYLSPSLAFFAAGAGSGLADLFAGYVAYVPATFVIKGIMAVVTHFVFKKLKTPVGVITGGVLAEVIMVAGYLGFESLLYGFVPSLANVPANCVQGVFCLVTAVFLQKIFEKYKIMQ